MVRPGFARPAIFSSPLQNLRRGLALASVAFSLAGCAGAGLILDHEEAHTLEFDWHRPGAHDREPPRELRMAALPAGTVVRGYPAPRLALVCLSRTSIACTGHAGTGWVIHMLDGDVAALVASGRLAAAAEPNTYVDVTRATLPPSLAAGPEIEAGEASTDATQPRTVR